LLHFLDDKGKKKRFSFKKNDKRKKPDIYSYRVCYLFLIFKFILIYLLHILFVLKIEGNYKKRKNQPKRAKMNLFLYI